MKHSRKSLFKKLGVTPTNERWSWCAMDQRQSKAVFTIWKDRIEDNRTVLTSTDLYITRRPGFKDQERVIEKVINHNLPAYGPVCEAVNTLETPRLTNVEKSGTDANQGTHFHSPDNQHLKKPGRNYYQSRRF